MLNAATVLFLFCSENLDNADEQLSLVRQENHALHADRQRQLNHLLEGLDGIRGDIWKLREDVKDTKAVKFSLGDIEHWAREGYPRESVDAGDDADNSQVNIHGSGLQGSEQEYLKRVPELAPETVERLTSGVSTLFDGSCRMAREQALLDSLNFEQRPARHDAIPEAHRKTFAWIFRKQTSADADADADATPHHFRDWLRNGSGLFWISGKPGAGKSTLMKYISGHGQTRVLLAGWSDSKKSIIGSHYFWSAGTPIQQSQEGLLRSLLFDVFGQAPSLMPTICKERWDLPVAAHGPSMQPPWTLAELRKTVADLVDGRELPSKFCFFVDGLDEFGGDHQSICELFRSFCRSRDVKVCVSSRPWNVFEDNFESCPKLCVHELTQQDIQAYAQSRLYEHPRWAALNRETTMAGTIISSVVSKSQGVFLWVFLVTKELRSGLTNGDNFNELQRRVESFPVELEAFFKHILTAVETFYHQAMAATLRIATAAKVPLSREIYAFHELEYDDEDYAIKEAVARMDPERLSKLLLPVSRRLNGRCKGLLELNSDSGKVEFLHRTVKDFLRTRDMDDFLKSKSLAKFEPTMAISRSYLAWVKHTDLSEPSRIMASFNRVSASEEFHDRVQQCVEYASAANDQDTWCRQASEILLDDLEMAVLELFRQRDPSYESSVQAEAIFRRHVLSENALNYISGKLDTTPDYFRNLTQHPLACGGQIERLAREEPVDWSPKRITLLRLLLQRCEPVSNKKLSIDAPWSSFIGALTRCKLLAHKMLGMSEVRAQNFITALNAGILDLFLQYGADGQALVGELPVWTRYLLVGFAVSNIELHANRYLSLLEDMLSAPFSIQAMSLDVTRGSFAFGGASGVPATAWQILEGYVSAPGFHVRQQHFLTRTLCILFDKAEMDSDTGLLEKVTKVLDNKLSPDLKAEILNRIRSRKTMEKCHETETSKEAHGTVSGRDRRTDLCTCCLLM